jgi:hypothetical protein
MDALKGGAIKVHPSDTDYALWMVDSVCGPVVAAPGDIITHYDDILTVLDSRFSTPPHPSSEASK